MLSEWEKRQPVNAKHRALIMQILSKFPDGLTTQQIIEQERRMYGYTFLTDNRLRELRKKGWVTNINELGKPLKWKAKT